MFVGKVLASCQNNTQMLSQFWLSKAASVKGRGAGGEVRAYELMTLHGETAHRREG